MTANGSARFGPKFSKAFFEAKENLCNPASISDEAINSIIEDIPIPSSSFNAKETTSLNRLKHGNEPIITDLNEQGLLKDEAAYAMLHGSISANPCNYRAKFMQGNELEYLATEEAYMAIYDTPSNSHLMGIRECRKYAKFSREKVSGEVKVFTSACRDRWCPMCASQKATYAKEQTKVYIESLKQPRMLTLTLKNDGNDLKSQIEFLTMSFRTLRQRAYWKQRVDGGIWFLQIKRGTGSGCWHPHFHIILDGEYMEQGRLSELWEQVTFGSPVIDIRRINDPEEVSSYVARYTARPARLSDMTLVDRIETIASLFRKRLCGTFGTAKEVTLTPPKIEHDGEWEDIGYYDKVLSDSQSKPAAKAILRAYFNDDVLTEEAYEAYTGKPANFILPEYKPPKPVQILLDFYHT